MQEHHGGPVAAACRAGTALRGPARAGSAPAASRTAARGPRKPNASAASYPRGAAGRAPTMRAGNGRGDRIRPRKGCGRRAAAARDLVQARAARPDDAVGPQRRRQDDAAADAGWRGVDRPRRAGAGEGREGCASRPATATRARAVAARVRPLGRARAGGDRGGALLARAGDGRRRVRRGDAGSLRTGAGPARARRWLRLARARACDAARSRVSRRAGPRQAAGHVLRGRADPRVARTRAGGRA